jgi:hypothetical protein
VNERLLARQPSPNLNPSADGDVAVVNVEEPPQESDDLDGSH